MVLLTTGVGEYVATTTRGRAIATDDPDRAKRFIDEAAAIDWARVHLKDRRFWAHECLPSFVRLPVEAV